MPDYSGLLFGKKSVMKLTTVCEICHKSIVDFVLVYVGHKMPVME